MDSASGRAAKKKQAKNLKITLTTRAVFINFYSFVIIPDHPLLTPYNGGDGIRVEAG